MAMMRVSFLSEALCRSVDLNVIVPMETMGIPGEVKPQKPSVFKTLYLLNGYSGNQDDWLTYSNIRALADQYNLAVVMPAGENHFYVDGTARGTFYGEFAGKELVEFTRNMFPLSHRREDTFIGGLSMGGFGAVRLGFYYFCNFSKIVSLSGAFVTDRIAGMKEGYTDGVGDFAYYQSVFGDLSRIQDSPKDPYWCAKRALEAKMAPKLYLSCGTEDFLIEENRKAKAKFEQLGIVPHYAEDTGIHDWKLWDKQLEQVLAWLLA